jgi:photosystem II stability/assembly factor-like uncharacterized protein
MTLVRLGLAAAVAIFVSASAFADISPFTKLSSLPGGGGTIAVDPTAPEKLYMSVGGGKIARSVDSGAHWTVVQVGTFNVQFGAIAVNPKHPNIVLAMTAPSLYFIQASIYESTDGGQSWKTLVSNLSTPTSFGPPCAATFGTGLIVNPTGTIIIASDTNCGVFRSTDSGKTWTNTLVSYIKAVVSDPSQPMTLWATGFDQGYNHAVWSSTDFGLTWSESGIPLADPNGVGLPESIAIQPKSGDILVTYGGFDPPNFVGRVALSKDGGKTWQNSSAGLSPALAPYGNLIFAPYDPKTVLFPAYNPEYPNGLYRSRNSGKTWSAIGSAKGLAGEGDISYLAAQPPGTKNPAQLLAGGSSFFSSTDRGTVWHRHETGLNAVGADAIWSDGTSGPGLYALGGDTLRLFHSTDGGTEWTHADNWTGSAEVSAFAVDAQAANHDAYAATTDASGSTIWRSTNFGTTWKKLGMPLPAGAFVSQIIVDPLKSGHVYSTYTAASIGNGLLRSVDAGQTWAKLSVGDKGDKFESVNSTILASFIIPDPGTDGTLYARMQSGFWKSTDHGTSWKKTGLLDNPAGISGFTIMSGKSETLFAADYLLSVGGGENFILQKSVDGGATWKTMTNPFATINSNAWFSVLAIPGDKLIAYLNCDGPNGFSGPGGQIMMSADKGNSWKLVDQPIIAELDSQSCPTVSVAGNNAYMSDPHGSQVIYTAPLGSL